MMDGLSLSSVQRYVWLCYHQIIKPLSHLEKESAIILNIHPRESKHALAIESFECIRILCWKGRAFKSFNFVKRRQLWMSHHMQWRCRASFLHDLYLPCFANLHSLLINNVYSYIHGFWHRRCSSSQSSTQPPITQHFAQKPISPVQ